MTGTCQDAEGWEQHHGHMAPAGQVEQAQRPQGPAEPAVAKHLEQHEGTSTDHKDLANLPTAHAQTPISQILATVNGEQLIIQGADAPHDQVGQHSSACDTATGVVSEGAG